MTAQVQIQHQGEHGPLEVIAHLAISPVGIRAVELHPGLLAAEAQRLDGAAGGESVAREIGAEVLQQVLLLTEAGHQGKELVVVAGHPLSEPEGGNHRGAVVIDRGELGGSQPPYVPLMQVFMRHELQQLAPALGFGQGLAAELEHRGVMVFQPAVTLIEQVEHEEIRGRRGPLHPHQPAAGEADPLHVSQPSGIGARQILTPAHPPVRHPGHREGMAGVGAGL